MAKKAHIGSINTKIYVKRPEHQKNPDGSREELLVNVFGEGGYRYCAWKNMHGRDRVEAYKFGLGNLATLTMRFSPLITPECLIFTSDTENRSDAWKIEDVDDVENRHAWIEIFIKRGERAI